MNYFWVVSSIGPSISGPILDECIIAHGGFQEQLASVAGLVSGEFDQCGEGL